MTKTFIIAGASVTLAEAMARELIEDGHKIQTIKIEPPFRDPEPDICNIKKNRDNTAPRSPKARFRKR